MIRFQIDPIEIPPLTAEVKAALEAYRDAWRDWKDRRPGEEDRLAASYHAARRHLRDAEARAVGPWWRLSDKSCSVTPEPKKTVLSPAPDLCQIAKV